jgi:class 3 adenylate cyclase/WD40 repeat protein/tRNA A-37 threonylcarbamoyl transferase component Bud32
MVTLIRERYELLETLGAGGEARVVKALDRQHDRFVALKIRPALDGRTRAELLNEARILLAVPPHPALPLVREDFFDGDDYVVAMDWVDGTDLAALLHHRGNPGLATSSVLAYLAQAAEALTHLHSQDPPVIHGDVKPGNLILTKGGRVKLVDFGMSSAPHALRRRTGTPGFRAPELSAARAPSRASDVYALAATAFALLSGSAPAGTLPAWEGIDPAQARQLEDAIRLGMATDPARRPATPGELVERLRAGWGAALPTGVVTFCLSDIEGSTAMWDAEPAAMADALVRHDELIAACVEAHGGRLLQSMGEGDSTVSVFHSAPQALDAALTATHALSDEPWPSGLRIAVRFGLHTGEAERRGADYFGPTINLAARLRGQADGGQIFLSSVTSELVAGHLPDGCELVDLGPHRLKGFAAPERIRALKAPGLRTPLPVTDCPYRGLLAFEPEDRVFFFGREEVGRELIGRLAAGRLVAVVGASGSGKSSVLRAGVVAAVLAAEVPGINDAIVLTPGDEPRLDVADRPGRLVVVDQFEELFTLCDDETRRRVFIDALLALDCPVAIGMRADLYGRLGSHAELARAVANNQILLGAMTDAELERSVTEPARLAGLRLEAGLVELVMRDVGHEPGALPLLSHALRATWERRDGRTMTVEGYRESGGVASAIARTADSVAAALPEERRHLMRSVFLRLTSLGEGTQDSSRPVTVEELIPEGGSPQAIRALLERLADSRLVTLGGDTVEVAHEVLIREWPTLRGWLTEDREGIRLHRELGDAARRWDTSGRETSDLYRGARLAAAVDSARELNAVERAFLDASVAEADRERRAQLRVNRRLRGLLVGAIVLLLVAGGAALIARHAQSAAQAQALRSDAERLGALALSAPSVERSLLLAVAGAKLHDSPETRSNLLIALQRNPAILRVLRLSPNEVEALAVSPDGRVLATGDRAGVIHFTDLRTWRPARAAARLASRVARHGIEYSPDGGTLAVMTRREDRWHLQTLDIATRRVRSLGTWRAFGPDPAVATSAYEPDGRRIVLALPTFTPQALTPVRERLMALDAASGRRLWERAYPMRPGQWEPYVLFTRSGTLITSAQQGDTLMWDTRAGRILRRFRIGGPAGLSADDRRLALALNSPNPGNPSARVAVLDLHSGARRTLASGLPSAWLDSPVFTRDGQRIVAAGFDGTHVWDVALGAIMASFGKQGHVGIALDPRGTALTAERDGSITAWDVNGARRLGRSMRWNTPDTGCGAGVCTVVNRQDTEVATVQADGTVALIDPRALRFQHTLPARNGPVANGIAFLPDGRTLLTGGATGRATLWDVKTQRVVRTLSFSGPVDDAVVSPNGRLLAVQSQSADSSQSRVTVRELASGRTLFTRVVRYGSDGLAFTGDELVAVGCCQPSSTVVAWDAHSGAARFSRALPEHAVAIEAAPDAKLLAVGTEAGKLLLWDPRTGRPSAPSLQVAAGGISQLSFAPDSRRIAVGSVDGTATVWDVRDRKRIGEPFPISTNLVPAVAFEPDGHLFITELGAVSEWPLDVSSWERFACNATSREFTRAEWHDLLPNRPYRYVCG